MTDLSGKTLFISGASRGIGKAIALRAARDGARIVVAAKTADAHPTLPGTIHDTAAEIEALGGAALPVVVDVRREETIQAAVEQTVARFGGIDILVNNASAISLTGTLETPMRRFDLMMQVNLRATFACSQACLPHLLKADNPHILTLSPPLDLDPRWFAPHTAYTISKFGMSMVMLGLAEEFRDAGVACNALWPRSVIDTAALRMLGGAIKPEGCRTPEIVADAAHAILIRPSRELTGQFLIDEDVLEAAGVTDFSRYRVAADQPLYPDLFVRGRPKD